MVFKKIIFQNSLMANETPSRPPPPPFMANAILNFHFDYVTPSLSLKFFPLSCSSYSSPFSIESISVIKLHEGTVQLLPSSVWVIFLKQSTRWVHLQSITFSWLSEFKSAKGWKAMKVVNLPLWEKNTPNSLSQQSPEWKSVEVKALLVRVGCAKCQK